MWTPLQSMIRTRNGRPGVEPMVSRPGKFCLLPRPSIRPSPQMEMFSQPSAKTRDWFIPIFEIHHRRPLGDALRVILEIEAGEEARAFFDLEADVALEVDGAAHIVAVCEDDRSAALRRRSVDCRLDRGRRKASAGFIAMVLGFHRELGSRPTLQPRRQVARHLVEVGFELDRPIWERGGARGLRLCTSEKCECRKARRRNAAVKGCRSCRLRSSAAAVQISALLSFPPLARNRPDPSTKVNV